MPVASGFMHVARMLYSQARVAMHDARLGKMKYLDETCMDIVMCVIVLCGASAVLQTVCLRDNAGLELQV